MTAGSILDILLYVSFTTEPWTPTGKHKDDFKCRICSPTYLEEVGALLRDVYVEGGLLLPGGHHEEAAERELPPRRLHARASGLQVHQAVVEAHVALNRRKIRLIEGKAKCRHLKKRPAKGLCGRCLIRVYRLEMDSVMLVFSTQLVNCCPSNLLSGSSIPLPPTLCE
jgi:hypothetical protein